MRSGRKRDYENEDVDVDVKSNTKFESKRTSYEKIEKLQQS